MSETIYDINNPRGDISVVLQRDWNAKVLQEMMNRDSSVDIYVLQYDRNEFSAMRNRDYLPDLSGNEKIAANVERMYPYVQDALKQNGKIIAIPTGFTGETLGINMRKLQLSADGELFEGFIELLVRDKKNLERMVEGLSHIDGVQDVIRTDI